MRKASVGPTASRSPYFFLSRLLFFLITDCFFLMKPQNNHYIVVTIYLLYYISILFFKHINEPVPALFLLLNSILISNGLL